MTSSPSSMWMTGVGHSTSEPAPVTGTSTCASKAFEATSTVPWSGIGTLSASRGFTASGMKVTFMVTDSLMGTISGWPALGGAPRAARSRPKSGDEPGASSMPLSSSGSVPQLSILSEMDARLPTSLPPKSILRGVTKMQGPLLFAMSGTTRPLPPVAGSSE